MPALAGGRHEHGQNFLIDTDTIDLVVALVSATDGPIVEIGPGRGALTTKLQHLRRPLTAVEIDARHVRWLGPRLRPGVRLVHGDFLRWRPPDGPHVVVGNLPFHLTTAMLRAVLHARGWTDAVLLVQWEVARRRAGVGGASMMTAQWWPWVEFAVERRVPSAAFDPVPGVDAGVLRMTRRATPLVSSPETRPYRAFVHAVFTGRGRGVPAIVSRLVEPGRRGAVARRLARVGVGPSALPKDLGARQWAAVWEAVARDLRARAG